LDEDIRDDIPQVSAIENDLLIESFAESKVKKAIFQMEHNKASCSDGFPAEFYQFFWETIKSDLMASFVEFHKGSLPLDNLNFGVITLVLEKQPTKIQQYRPICLLNVSFKIFTKVITNRISVFC
jgi:hypothetical protein